MQWTNTFLPKPGSLEFGFAILAFYAVVLFSSYYIATWIQRK